MMMKYSMMLVAVSGAAAVKIASDDAVSNPKKTSSGGSVKKMLATALVLGSSVDLASAQDNNYGRWHPDMCNYYGCIEECYQWMPNGCKPIVDSTNACGPVFNYQNYRDLQDSFGPNNAFYCFKGIDNASCQASLTYKDGPCSAIFNEYSVGYRRRNLEAPTNTTSKDWLEASTNTTSKDWLEASTTAPVVKDEKIDAVHAGEKLQFASSCPNNDVGRWCQSKCEARNSQLSLQCCNVWQDPYGRLLDECFCSPNGGQSLCQAI